MTTTTLRYFAYGSNMSLARLQARTPSARRIATCTLAGHSLRFHKRGQDGSGKCDAFYTGDSQHSVVGSLFEIAADEQPALDRAEGLGSGYELKTVELIDCHGIPVDALTYYATVIDPALQPFSWYKHHVLVGARESGLPDDYIAVIETFADIEDTDLQRHRAERAVHDNRAGNSA